MLVLAVVLLLLSSTALVLFLIKFLKNLGGRGGGWTKLAEAFPASGAPAGDLLRRQTVQVGAVVYKNCTAVGVSPAGLYLAVKIPFASRLKPLMIPWEGIQELRTGALHWKKTVILSVGRPEIGTVTVFRDFYEKLRPFLRSDIQPTG